MHTKNEYFKIVCQSHVGLCLKLSSSRLANTTFPSKVIEIAANQLLLITTKVSDIPFLFDDKSARILKSEDANALVETIIAVIENRDESEKMAEVGKLRILQTCSSDVVGKQILNFLH